MRNQDKLMGKMFIGFTIFSSLITGCGKKAEVGPAAPANGSNTSKVNDQTATPTTTPVKAKFGLGQSEDFAILAYAGISSVPNSVINGKVGLMPGTREQIVLEASEVTGGAADIIGSEDETVPYNLLSNAKVDMVTSYSKISGLEGDKDKVNMFAGALGGKSLTPGTYQWNDTIAVDKNFTIEGNETDTWIFKVKGNLKVNEGVQMVLSGGAKPRNIIWHVAGSAVLEANSQFAGTIIAQPSIELKSHSVLTGRAFAKNGYVKLTQATINKP